MYTGCISIGLSLTCQAFAPIEVQGFQAGTISDCAWKTYKPTCIRSSMAAYQLDAHSLVRLLQNWRFRFCKLVQFPIVLGDGVGNLCRPTRVRSRTAVYQSDSHSLEILVESSQSSVKFTSLEMESGTAANHHESLIERRYINWTSTHSKFRCY